MQISHAVLEELVTSYIVTLYYAAFLPFVFSGSILILLCCKLGYPIMHNYSENTTVFKNLSQYIPMYRATGAAAQQFSRRTG